MVHRSCGALALSLLIACGGPKVATRIDFNPVAEPACHPAGGRPPPLAPEAARLWDDYQSRLKAFGEALGTKETNPSLVLDQLRKGIQALADSEGCRITEAPATMDSESAMFRFDFAKYDITCPPLPATPELARQRIVQLVREQLPGLLQAARDFLLGCPSVEGQKARMAFTFLNSAMAGGSGPEHFNKTNNEGAFRISAGCSYFDYAKCDVACAHGDPQGCTMAGNDPAKTPDAKQKLLMRACELETARADKASDKTSDQTKVNVDVCTAVLQGPNAQLRSQALDLACKAKPDSDFCLMYALNPQTRPDLKLFTKARAEQVAAAIDACTDGCNLMAKFDLTQYNEPFFEVSRARRAIQWLADRCAAGNAKGCEFGLYADSTVSPAYSRKIATQLLTVAERGCSAEEPTLGATAAKWCDVLGEAYGAKGTIPEPKKQTKVLSRACALDPLLCTSLARCVEKGGCAGAGSARSIWAKACDAQFADLKQRFPDSPLPDRQLFLQCRKADGAAK